jgi:type IV secretion system protein VirB4
MDPVSLVIGGAAGAGAAALLRRGGEHRTVPAGLNDLLGWAWLVDDGVVAMKDGALLAGLTFRGPDLASATAAELTAVGVHLNDALLTLSDGWMVHVDAIRAPAPPPSDGGFPDPVTGWIDAERRAELRAARQQFVTDTVLTVTYLPPREAYARAARLFVQDARGDGGLGAVLAGFVGTVDALRRRLASRLSVARLGSDALVTHLHRCLTGLAYPVTAPPHGAYLDILLASQELVGGFAPRVGDLHLQVVAVTGYPPRAPVGRLDALATFPFAHRWSTRFVAASPHTAATLIKRHQQRWFMSRRGVGSFLRDVASKDQGRSEWRERQDAELFHDRNATDMTRDAAEALAENASGAVRFGFATQCVVVADPDPVRARANARTVVAAAQDLGLAARIETVNAMDALFGTMPGHGRPNLRRPMISTSALAGLLPVTSVWPGLPHNPSPFFPPRTPPLMQVATDGATPFRFHLHAGDVGHTLLVGATGAGKSTFVGLTVAQWQRYAAPDGTTALGAQTYVFDVGYSHWLLCQAAGGQHYDIGAGRVDALAFQPLADVDVSSERAWAASWLEMLFELQGVTVTPPQRLRIDRALQLLAGQLRPFRTLTEFTLQLQDRVLADALRPYTVGGTYGRLLDASEDAVAEGRYQVFELRHLLDLDDRIPRADAALPVPARRASTGRPPDAHRDRGAVGAADEDGVCRSHPTVAPHTSEAERGRHARRAFARATRSGAGQAGADRELSPHAYCCRMPRRPTPPTRDCTATSD